MKPPAKALLDPDLEIGVKGTARRPIGRLIVFAALWCVFTVLAFSWGFHDGAIWIGRMTVPITVTVVDSATRQPIANAQVVLVDPVRRGNTSKRTTALTGQAVVPGDFTATGNSSTWKNSCSVSFLSYWVECSAPGFRVARVSLAAHLGHRIDPRTATPRPIVIALESDSIVRIGPFASIAGEYVQCDEEAVVTMRIDAGGRCLLTERDVFGNAAIGAGTIRLADDALEFSFTDAADHQRLQSAPNRMCIVAWGPRLYLVRQAEFPLFLSSAREGAEPRSSAFGFYLLREGDWEMAVAGLPAVTSVSPGDSAGSGGKTQDRR